MKDEQKEVRAPFCSEVAVRYLTFTLSANRSEASMSVIGIRAMQRVGTNFHASISIVCELIYVDTISSCISSVPGVCYISFDTAWHVRCNRLRVNRTD